MTIPAVVFGSGSVTAQVSSNPPIGAPKLQAMARTSRSRTAASDYQANPLVFVTIVSSTNIALAQTPVLSAAVPTSVTFATGSSPWVALFDPTRAENGWSVIAGPGQINGQVASVETGESATFLSEGESYTYALFTTTAQLAQPVSVFPAALAFTGYNQTQTITIGGGVLPYSLQATSQSMGCVTPVESGIVTVGATATPTQFVVSSLTNAGCAILIATDANGQVATAVASVTIANPVLTFGEVPQGSSSILALEFQR